MEYDYDETVELGRGGMAVVYEATSRSTGAVVALKRPLPYPDAAERLRREISVLTAVHHPSLIVVEDHGVDDDGEPWYVMPLAVGSLSTLLESDALGGDMEEVASRVLEDVSGALAAMHAAGFVHRDLTPSNVLAFKDESREGGLRWVLSDCGLVRRPLGETTAALTGSAAQLGTMGYMAPESFGAPHEVTDAADIYSLGRVLARVITGKRPTVITDLLPESGPWRQVIRRLTRYEASQRPQSVEAALLMARTLLAALPTSEKATFRTRISEGNGELAPEDELWQVALDNLDDFDFVIDDVVDIAPPSVKAATEVRAESVGLIAERMARHLVDGEWGSRGFNRANANLDWILGVLKALLAADQFDVVADIAPAYFGAVKAWNRFAHDDKVSDWLVSLEGPAAEVVTRAVNQSSALEYLRELLKGRRPKDASLAALFGS